MRFLLQFAISYVATILVVSISGSKRLSEVWVIAITYGIVAFPFGLATAVLAGLFERFIGWPGGIVAVVAVCTAMYFIARHKENFWSGTAPSAVTFAAVWCFLSWRHAFAAG